MNRVFDRKGNAKCYGMKNGYHTYELPWSTQLRHGYHCNNIVASAAVIGGGFCTEQTTKQGRRLMRKIVRLLNGSR